MNLGPEELSQLWLLLAAVTHKVRMLSVFEMIQMLSGWKGLLSLRLLMSKMLGKKSNE